MSGAPCAERFLQHNKWEGGSAMDDLYFMQSLLEQYGQWLLFGVVVLEQIGLPVPAYPSLIIAGALSARMAGAASLLGPLGVVVAACLTADIAWYWAGRRFGSVLTHLICRLSLSPTACVLRSASFYHKYGPRILLIAKFFPGAGAMTTLLSGTSGARLRTFIVFDAVGSAIWGGFALALGYAFQDTVAKTIALLKPFALYGVVVAISLACVALAIVWYRRRPQQVSVKLQPRMPMSSLRQLLTDKEL